MRVHRQERDTLRTIPREVQTVLGVHIAPVDGVAVLILALGIVTAPARAQLMLPQPAEHRERVGRQRREHTVHEAGIVAPRVARREDARRAVILIFSIAARGVMRAGRAGISVGGRWPAGYVRDSTAFWADRGEVTWRCFTVFHVELSVRRLVAATALDLKYRVGRAITRNMTRYYLRLVYKTKGDNALPNAASSEIISKESMRRFYADNPMVQTGQLRQYRACKRRASIWHTRYLESSR